MLFTASAILCNTSNKLNIFLFKRNLIWVTELCRQKTSSHKPGEQKWLNSYKSCSPLLLICLPEVTVTMSALYRNVIRVADKLVPASAAPVWNHPAGYYECNNFQLTWFNWIFRWVTVCPLMPLVQIFTLAGDSRCARVRSRYQLVHTWILLDL